MHALRGRLIVTLLRIEFQNFRAILTVSTSHNANTPLFTIRDNFVELLSSRASPDVQVRVYLTRVNATLKAEAQVKEKGERERKTAQKEKEKKRKLQPHWAL